MIVGGIIVCVLACIGAGIAILRERNDIADILWGMYPAIMTIALMVEKSSWKLTETLIVGVLVVIWGSRLSVFIGRRFVRHTTEDPRYASMRARWGIVRWRQYVRTVTTVFGLQLVLSAVVILAPLLAQLRGESVHGVWVVLFYLAATCAALGFVIEAVADQQSRTHRSTVTGIWRLCRHPNYFGEALFWVSLSVACCVVGSSFVPLISGVLVFVLVRFVSGVPSHKPVVEEAQSVDIPLFFPTWKSITNTLRQE